MATEPIGEYFNYNGCLKPLEEFVPDENEGGVYEVLRVIEGKPLFLDDHLDRMYRSAQIAGIKIHFEEKEIAGFLQALIAKNKTMQGNILVSAKNQLKVFFIPHFYPSEKDYREGVNCGLLRAERLNPNAKVFQTLVRERANRMIATEGLYEVLLVDHDEKITEGSKSNAFFVKSRQVFTPPPQKVLLGITRSKTIDCARKHGIELLEKEINVRDLATFDSVFISGTSPKLLPVKQIGSQNYDPQNRLLRKLMKAYNEMIREYLERV